MSPHLPVGPSAVTLNVDSGAQWVSPVPLAVARSGHRRGQVCLIVSRCPWTRLGKPEAVGAWPAVTACWERVAGSRRGGAAYRQLSQP